MAPQYLSDLNTPVAEVLGRNIIALLIVDNCMPQGSIWQPSEDVCSPALHHQHETLYKVHSKTLLHPYLVFQKHLKTFSFSPTQQPAHWAC